MPRVRLPRLILTAAALAGAGAIGGCAGSGAPTYTDARVTLGPCPGAGLRPGRHIHVPFTVVNRSHRTWPATYVLLSLQEAAKGSLGVTGHRTEDIGGGIKRVTSPLGPGASIDGTVNVYLNHARSGVVTVGGWGAPGNSVAVPTSYPSPSCTLRP